MLRLLPGTAAILLTHLILAAAFSGIGLAIRRGFGLRRVTLDDLFLSFWMGFAAVILFLILWNFVLPIGGTALGLVLACGALGLLAARTELRGMFVDADWRPGRGTVVAVFAVTVWVAVNSLGAARNWDTSLYHLQGEKWAHSYRAVPGIANLMAPFAFNNSALLYDAMVDAGPWAGRPWHVANGLFVVVLASQAIVCGARFLSRPGVMRAADLFGFLVLAVPLDALMGDRASSLITDQATTMVLLALTTRWFASLIPRPREPLEEAFDLFAIVTLAALAVALKMNAAIVASMSVITATVLWLRAHGASHPFVRRTAIWSLAAGIVFGAAWTTRGIVLSGYPLFPMSRFGAPVAWRAPAEHAQAEFDYIVDSGRATVENIPVVSGQAGMSAWLPDWLRRAADDPYDIYIPAALVAVSLVTLVALRRGPAPGEGPSWWMALPWLAAIGAWFRVAPEPRYIVPLVWSLVALVATQAYRHSSLAAAPAGSGARRLVLLGALTGISPLVVNPLLEWYRQPEGSPLRALAKANIKIPPPGHWLEPPHPQPPLTRFETRSGLALNVPRGRCWDAPLPCTTNPAPNLRLRIPGRLDGGFVVDGPWEMQNWPEPWRPRYLPAWRAGRASRGND